MAYTCSFVVFLPFFRSRFLVLPLILWHVHVFICRFLASLLASHMRMCTDGTHTHTRGWWQQIALRQHSTFQTNNKTTPPPHIAQHSVFELGQQFFGISEGSSGLSVLRTFRLLRILKLVRFMPNLRRQLFVMLRTMDNVAIFFSLLILFIFIFR